MMDGGDGHGDAHQYDNVDVAHKPVCLCRGMTVKLRRTGAPCRNTAHFSAERLCVCAQQRGNGDATHILRVWRHLTMLMHRKKVCVRVCAQLHDHVHERNSSLVQQRSLAYPAIGRSCRNALMLHKHCSYVKKRDTRDTDAQSSVLVQNRDHDSDQKSVSAQRHCHTDLQRTMLMQIVCVCAAM